MSNPVKQIVDSAGNILSIVDYEARNIIAPAYSISRTYTVGEYCIYNNKMYKCTISVDTPGSFDPNNWSEITNSDELSELHSSLTNREKHIGGLVYVYWNAVSVTIDFGGAIPTEATSNANTIIATLPSDVPKPSTTKYAVASCGGSSNRFALVAIQTNGNILVYNYSGASTSYLYGSIKFLR